MARTPQRLKCKYPPRQLPRRLPGSQKWQRYHRPVEQECLWAAVQQLHRERSVDAASVFCRDFPHDLFVRAGARPPLLAADLQAIEAQFEHGQNFACVGVSEERACPRTAKPMIFILITY